MNNREASISLVWSHSERLSKKLSWGKWEGICHFSFHKQELKEFLQNFLIKTAKHKEIQGKFLIINVWEKMKWKWWCSMKNGTVLQMASRRMCAYPFLGKHQKTNWTTIDKNTHTLELLKDTYIQRQKATMRW